MNCKEIEARLDDYLDGNLSPTEQVAVERHMQACAACRAELQSRRDLLMRLRELPVPSMRPGFQARAFRQARQGGHTRHFGFAAGFGSAIAAGLVLWFGLTTWWPQELPETAPLQAMVLRLDEPKEVRLVFTAKEDIQQVDFVLELPKGVELAGFPHQREIHWRDRLDKGRNALHLSLLAASLGTSGEVVATINHAGQQRVFRIPVKAGEDTSGYLPSLETMSQMI
jgi:hypothetical protein